MTSFESGDVVLVRYPFTDLSTLKKRPAVVQSSRDYTERFGDVVLMPLTSVRAENSLAISHWQSAGLMKPSRLKPVVGTLISQLIEKHLGRLSNADELTVRAALQVALDTRWVRMAM